MAGVMKVLIRCAVGVGAASFYDLQKPVLDGCYYQEHKYIGDDLGTPSLENNFTTCQLRCQQNDKCEYFTYFPSKHCWLNGKEAIYDDKWAVGAISGSKFCPVMQTGCTERPGEGFPGATPDLSEQAWPSHRIPEKLECWPRNETKGWYNSCPVMEVLEDTKSGWPGLCKGLYQVQVTSEETCESLCMKHVTCSVWQVMNDTAKSCWHGEGVDCYHGGDFAPLSGARVMHGEVRVLADLKGVQIMGLQPAFDAYFFVNQTHDAVMACRNHCYSNLECEYWQYSRSKGCWTENPDLVRWTGVVEYPITTQSWQNWGEFADSVIAGEYIQHVCKGKGPVPEKFSAAIIPEVLHAFEAPSPSPARPPPMMSPSPSLEGVEAAPPVLPSDTVVTKAPVASADGNDLEGLSLATRGPEVAAQDTRASPPVEAQIGPEMAVAVSMPQQEGTESGSSRFFSLSFFLLLVLVVGLFVACVGLMTLYAAPGSGTQKRAPRRTRYALLETSASNAHAADRDALLPRQDWDPERAETHSAALCRADATSSVYKSEVPSVSSFLAAPALPFPEAGLPRNVPFPEVQQRASFAGSGF